jgi:hypothetical protein
MLAFRMHKEYPASQRLQVHLENEQQVYFDETDKVLDDATMQETENYHLRMFLYHVRGTTSFTDLQTVYGVEYATYQEVAMGLEILEHDNQWKLCLEEAAAFQSPSSLHDLFYVIIDFFLPFESFSTV